MVLDLSRHEAIATCTLWEAIGDDELVLTVGSGPLDEYRIWRRDSESSWSLAMAGAASRGVLTYSEVDDAKRDAVRHLTSLLWGDLTS